MDRLREFLETVRAQGADRCPFRGLLHVLVGRRVTLADGTLVSPGMSWRDAAAVLKKYRWDREAVRELGLDPKELPPRDREKFWYTAISRAAVSGPDALRDAEAVIEVISDLGYTVSSGPDKPATPE